MAPRNDIERRIERIWCDVLGIERLGIEENFFDIGGHSILATRAMARLRQECQIDLPLRALFECPTIAAIGARVAAEVSAKDATAKSVADTFLHLFELKSGDRKKPVFFLPGGVGGDEEFLVYARFLHYVDTDHTFYGLRARSANGEVRCQPSVSQMAADYIREIQRVQPEGPYHIVGNCTGGIVAQEIACQLEARRHNVGLLVLMDTDRPTWSREMSHRWRRMSEPATQRLRDVRSRISNCYWIARLSYHWTRMGQLRWREVAPYLLSRAGTAINNMPHVSPANAVAEDRSAMPVDKHKLAIQHSYERTLRRHRPGRFHGRMILIVNQGIHDRDASLGWSGFAAGGIEIYRVSGDHESYIREHVQELGKQFRFILARNEGESAVLAEIETESHRKMIEGGVFRLGWHSPTEARVDS